VSEAQITVKQGVQAVGQARSALTLLPKWLQVLLFLGLAIVCGLAGTLDDWLRVALAILFVGLALTLAAEGLAGIQAHRTGKGAAVVPQPSPVDPFPTTDAG
jgi:hypothetical protein